MQPLKCPHCGAPAQVPPGQPMYQCPYCHQQFATGFQPPPPPQPMQHQPMQQQGPTFIIIHGPGDDDDDDDDFDHHHHQAAMVSHAVSHGISWLIWVVVMVFVVLIAGGGALFAFFAKRSSLASSLVWDGTAPFTCGGIEEVNVKGVNANFNAGTAINVGGNCKFTCTDCTIKAPTAIEAGGNGTVTIVNGTIEGTDTLVEAGLPVD